MGVWTKGAAIGAALAFQKLPRVAIRAAQRKKLAKILALAETLPHYRDTFAAAGVRAADFRELEDLARFPLLTKAAVRAGYPTRLLARPVTPADVYFKTSGTSGQFMEIVYGAEANTVLDAVYLRALLATGWRPWQRMAYFWWDPKPESRNLVQRVIAGRKYMRPVDPNPDVQLSALREIKPHVIYHFPSSLAMLARIIEPLGGPIALGFRPEIIISHGELLLPETRAVIERGFGCKVWNQYGAQEMNRIGWDCDAHAGLHLAADTVHLEVLGEGGQPVADGEEGELVLTNLVNDLMPFVRYRIGDAGRVIPGPCACGSALPRFELTEGRFDDVLRIPDGRRIGPRSLAPVIEDLPGISQYRVIQSALDRVKVLIVPESGTAGDATAASVGAAVRGILGAEVQVETSVVAEIPLSRRGKLRKIVCEIV